MKSLNEKKSAIGSCISVKVLIEPVGKCLKIFTDIVNNSISNDIFAEELSQLK